LNKILIIPICLLLSSCSLLRTPSKMGFDNSDILISSGAVQVNITVSGNIQKGAVVNTFNLYVSSGAFNTYLDRMSVFGGKEINK